MKGYVLPVIVYNTQPGALMDVDGGWATVLTTHTPEATSGHMTLVPIADVEVLTQDLPTGYAFQALKEARAERDRRWVR